MSELQNSCNIIVNPVLCNKNPHPRDKYIKFYEEGHKYEILTDSSSTYTSVTTWVHNHFPKFDAEGVITKMMRGRNWNSDNKYWGMAPAQIQEMWSASGKEASTAGTALHNKIEQFMNHDIEEGTENGEYFHMHLLNHYTNTTSNADAESGKNAPEWEYFIDFVRNFPELKPYRTEWMVYDEDVKLSGSIDMVYENTDGTLSIYDWKRSKEIAKATRWSEFANTYIIKHIPATQFWKYAMQLNTYRKILERKYGKIVKELFLVKLHPTNAMQTYELINVPILDDDMNNLFEALEEEQCAAAAVSSDAN